MLIATGAHVAKKVDIPGKEHPDNWLSLVSEAGLPGKSARPDR